MLGNKACPNQLIDTAHDEYDYTRYRKYVLFRLRNLKFLDCYEVTRQEREQISSEERFFDVVKLEEPIGETTSTKSGTNKTPKSEQNGYTSLLSKNEDTEKEIVPQSNLDLF
jgi:hypothetical protein